MRRGEIWWGSPTVAGRQQKRRPFVIVSNDAFNANERYPKALVVHLTTVTRPSGPYSWDVPVPRGRGGLAAPSLAKCNEIYTVWKTDLDECSGMLAAPLMAAIDRALAVALSLPAPARAND
jgi:mRNA-degrading endonuclease toxin of MazEF toxin-antitoxin module